MRTPRRGVHRGRNDASGKRGLPASRRDPELERRGGHLGLSPCTGRGSRPTERYSKARDERPHDPLTGRAERRASSRVRPEEPPNGRWTRHCCELEQRCRTLLLLRLAELFERAERTTLGSAELRKLRSMLIGRRGETGPMPSSVVLETGQQLVIVFDAARRGGVSLRGGGAGFWQVETDAGLPFHVDVVVERGPVLPAVTVARCCSSITHDPSSRCPRGGEADGGHQATDQQGLLFADRLAPGRCEQALPDAGKATAAFLAVEAVRIDRGAGRQHALKIGGVKRVSSSGEPRTGIRRGSTRGRCRAACRCSTRVRPARGCRDSGTAGPLRASGAVVAELEVGPGADRRGVREQILDEIQAELSCSNSGLISNQRSLCTALHPDPSGRSRRSQPTRPRTGRTPRRPPGRPRQIRSGRRAHEMPGHRCRLGMSPQM